MWAGLGKAKRILSQSVESEGIPFQLVLPWTQRTKTCTNEHTDTDVYVVPCTHGIETPTFIYIFSCTQWAQTRVQQRISTYGILQLMVPQLITHRHLCARTHSCTHTLTHFSLFVSLSSSSVFHLTAYSQ